MRVFSPFLFNLFEMEETGGVWKTTVSWEFSMANVVSVLNKESCGFCHPVWPCEGFDAGDSTVTCLSYDIYHILLSIVVCGDILATACSQWVSWGSADRGLVCRFLVPLRSCTEHDVCKTEQPGHSKLSPGLGLAFSPMFSSFCGNT